MHKLTIIVILLLATSMITLQQNAAAVKEAVHGKTEIATLSVNINTASAEQIADVLNGVGLTKAKLIVAHRKTHGAFKDIKELLEIKGIGPATLEKNLKRVTL